MLMLKPFEAHFIVSSQCSEMRELSLIHFPAFPLVLYYNVGSYIVPSLCVYSNTPFDVLRDGWLASLSIYYDNVLWVAFPFWVCEIPL